MPATVLENKVMYRQFIHIVAFVNLKRCTCLRPLYLYFPDTPRIYVQLLPQRNFRMFTSYVTVCNVRTLK